jgi:quinol monooxygenase YgiN
MFARKVYVRLKQNGLSDFAQLMEREIFPWLRTQEGFLDAILMVAPDGQEVQVLSFWDQADIAKEHGVTQYPAAVVKALETLLDEITYGRTFEVVASTMLPGHRKKFGGAIERLSSSSESACAASIP